MCNFVPNIGVGFFISSMSFAPAKKSRVLFTVYLFMRKFGFVAYVVECEKWKLASNVSAENGIFYSSSSLAHCMELCISISNCVAIDFWSDVCSIHINKSDLLSNRVTSGVSQFVLDRSCEVSTLSTSSLQTVVTTKRPTSRSATTATLVTTEYSTVTPGIHVIIENWLISLTSRFH